MPSRETEITATLSVPSTASTTTIGTAFTVPLKYQAAYVSANMNGLTGGVLDVYLCDSFDGGATWKECAHFTQVSAAGTRQEGAGLSLSSTIQAIKIAATTTPTVGTLTAGTLRSAPWGSTMCIVAVSGSGTSGSAAVQTIRFGLTDYAE